ncbi:MAG: nucleotidyltransferase family protein [Bacteriovoracaceae bacterium]|nr:nucleotidyltransferase family protein [Bacteriovoracaceae bacterium]
MNVTAYLLCAGFGTRMGEATKSCPKPMLDINGKPLLEYTLRHLKSLGVSNVVINLHYLAKAFTEYFSDGSALGLNITYLHEPAPTGTAGGVLRMHELAGNPTDHLLVIYGDILTDLDYREFMKFHHSHSGLASMVVHQRHKSNSYVEMDQSGKVVRFLERPKNNPANASGEPYWVNSAIYCISPETLGYIQKNEISDWPKDIFPHLVKEGNLYAYKLGEAHRVAIDTGERLELARSEINHYNFNF